MTNRVRVLLLACAAVVLTGDPVRAQDGESAYTYARALYAHPGRGLRIYARAPGTQRVVSVPDTAVWPESGGRPGETEAMYVVISDSAGRVVGIKEFPINESTGTENRYIHYFDEDGRVVALRSIGCPPSPTDVPVAFGSLRFRIST